MALDIVLTLVGAWILGVLVESAIIDVMRKRHGHSYQFNQRDEVELYGAILLIIVAIEAIRLFIQYKK